jgi:gas vesicle protein
MRRKDRQSQALKKLAIGSVVAAAAGYVAGVLTAPKSGKETRKDIKSAADKSWTQAEKELKRLHTELDKVIKDSKKAGDKAGSKAKKEIEGLVEKAQDTKEKARQVLSAVHEGDAEDKDLKKAIKDANDAISHLRDYLKK